MRLEGKICVITGASRGIGLEAAKIFAHEAGKVYLFDVDEKAGKELEAEININGGNSKFIRVDIANIDQVRNAFSYILEADGRVDVLYNNASVFLGKQDNIISEVSPEIWDKVIGINLNGLFYCCKYAIPLMIDNGGSIINTSSSAGIIGIPKCAAYTATKGATVSLTKAMAVEYGPRGIRVNCIAPAAIKTAMVLQSNLTDPDFDEEIFLKQGTPLRRWGEAAEVAQIALFLASDESSYLNGTIIVADGGITIS